MKRLRVASARTVAVLLLSLAWAGATSPSQAEVGSARTYTFDDPELEIRNLIGEITVTGHAGSSYEVVVTPMGKDAEEGSIKIVREDEGNRVRLTVRFPSERGKYVYPRMGKGSSTSFSPDGGKDKGWLSEVLGELFGGKVTVRGSGSGLEMWADIEVRVPTRGELVVRHGVGKVHADGVDGKLDLQVRSGRCEARAIAGDLAVSSGSGRVKVTRIDGRLEASTGSGGIVASEVRGPRLRVSTGSGSVELERIETESLSVATGSGRVEALGVSTDQAEIGTGSGGVRLELDRMGSGRFEIGTGSGGVVLKVPSDASLDVHAETGSGGIDLDLDGEMTMRRMKRDEVEFTLRGGDAKVRIGTGSGGIRITE
jgi:hypothetical protein